MIVSELFSQINSAYRGADDNVPTSGTPDYTNWIAATNRKIQEWATDSKNNWASNFYYEKPNEPGTVATTGTTTLTGTSTHFTDYNTGDTILVSGETVRIIDTITSDTVLTVTVAFSNTASGKTFTHASIIKTGVQSYSLHRNLINPSDKTYIQISTTNIPEFVIGKPQERDRYLSEVYISGKNPKTITFYDTIDATNNSSWIGGTLKVPGYYTTDAVTGDDDEILVDDPFWLVYAVASELAFNDLTYEDKAPDLNAKANNLYQGMVNDNRRGTNNNPRVARTNVYRIPNVRNENTSWSE